MSEERRRTGHEIALHFSHGRWDWTSERKIEEGEYFWGPRGELLQLVNKSVAAPDLGRDMFLFRGEKTQNPLYSVCTRDRVKALLIPRNLRTGDLVLAVAYEKIIGIYRVDEQDRETASHFIPANRIWGAYPFDRLEIMEERGGEGNVSSWGVITPSAIRPNPSGEIREEQWEGVTYHFGSSSFALRQQYCSNMIHIEKIFAAFRHLLETEYPIGGERRDAEGMIFVPLRKLYREIEEKIISSKNQ